MSAQNVLTSTQNAPILPISLAAEETDSRRLNFDLAVSLSLHRWPALTVAVQNEWGGPESEDKRLWFAGAISQLFEEREQQIDVADVEDMLLQVMLDEFGVALEDDSEIEVAARVWQFWIETKEGNFKGVQRAWREWGARSCPGTIVEGRMNDEETDDEEGDAYYDIDEDAEMGDAAPPVEVREKSRPEVDDEGFTMVKGRKKKDYQKQDIKK